jgi:hypothetical protein
MIWTPRCASLKRRTMKEAYAEFIRARLQEAEA